MQRKLEPVTRVIERDPSKDALVRAAERERDVLADDEAAVGVDRDADDEARDREEPARLGRRGRRDR